MKQAINSARKYLIVVFLILIIFGITVKLFVDFSQIPLSKSVNKIVQTRNDFTQLDQCIYKLYNAENNCRMFVVTGDRSFYKKFVDDIREVSLIMDTIELHDENKKSISYEVFDGLIAQKKLGTTQFILLRHLSDSLLNFSNKLEKHVNNLKPENKSFKAEQFKNIIRIDTLKPKTVEQTKKKLFARVFDAIGNKNKQKIDSIQPATLVKTTITHDTTAISLAYNNLQLKKINEYYTKLYELNKKLKSKERDLLNVNSQLIDAVVEGLEKYKKAEKDYNDSVRDIVDRSAQLTLKNLDNFTVILIFFVIGLLLFVFYTIYNFYKTEQRLILYSNKASLYAKSKSRFLANMSHEIRTPLNSIVGFSEQLSQVSLQPKHKEQIAAIRNSSIMLLDVVNDILDFSKYETGKVSLERIPFSVNVAITDIFDSMKIQAAKKKLDYLLNIPIDKDVYIMGDPLRLKQVVMNLLSNAIKFTLKGSVTLNATFIKKQGNDSILMVDIIDTGNGINDADQKIIFDEFAQVYYSSTKEKQQGTGLGLAICKKIVEIKSGKIGVKSEIGKGSVFSFEIPYKVVQKPIQKENSTLFDSKIKVLKGKKVLLADDNMLNILLAGTILKKYKMVFDAAYDGNEAFELFKDNVYDIVLTDIQMPEMGGIELTQKIRNNENLVKNNIPILGVTANVMEEDRTKYLQSGMNDLVFKPFLEKELIEKILTFVK